MIINKIRYLKPGVLSLATSFALLGVISIPSAQADLDFDGDGVADTLGVNITTQGLDWVSLTSQGVLSNEGNLFGDDGHHLIPNNWDGVDRIGTVSESGDNLLWSIEGGKSITFGANTLVTVVSGGDFDGSGFGDAVIVDRSDKKKATATIWYDPFKRWNYY